MLLGQRQGDWPHVAAGLFVTAAHSNRPAQLVMSDWIRAVMKRHDVLPSRQCWSVQVKFTFSVPYLKRYQKEGLTCEVPPPPSSGSNPDSRRSNLWKTLDGTLGAFSCTVQGLILDLQRYYRPVQLLE